MINEGQIKAKLNSQQKMISFIDTASVGVNEDARESEYLEIIEELEQQNQRIIGLMDQITKVDAGI